MGERKIERETGAGERKRDRDGERKIERETGAGERQRDRSGRERERQGRKRRTDRGEREKITNSKKFMESCRATIHCRVSIRLP